MEVPEIITPCQLQKLLNSLLSNAEVVPYSFFVDSHELYGRLGAHLQQFNVCMRMFCTGKADWR